MTNEEFQVKMFEFMGATNARLINIEQSQRDQGSRIGELEKSLDNKVGEVHDRINSLPKHSHINGNGNGKRADAIKIGGGAAGGSIIMLLLDQLFKHVFGGQ